MADQGKKAEIFDLDNGAMQVKITNYGCAITSLSVPDKDGEVFFFALLLVGCHLTSIVDYKLLKFFLDVAIFSNLIYGFCS